MIWREQHVVNSTLNYRYPGASADHAIIIHAEGASDDGVPESVRTRHAARGLDVWRMDAAVKPRFSLAGWAEASIALGEHVTQSTGLPVFIMGASRSAALAFRALQDSDVFWGAVLIGGLDQHNGADSKPNVHIVGKQDTTLMSPAALSDIVLDWCLRQFSNHFNPKWKSA